ncbi:TPA: hypothetical protein QCO65_004839 [Bacillus cereus]|uniref:hypothetical protein n=1 Tax=Bacillus sp. FSL H8-0545 TaxID=2921402 RepID=UPI0030F74B03|nr:hypothetical protein [Bacillus cereus]
MILTKQEQAVVIGTFISILGENLVNEHFDAKRLEEVSKTHNEMHDNTTPRERRAAMISLLNKMMDEFLKG